MRSRARFRPRVLWKLICINIHLTHIGSKYVFRWKDLLEFLICAGILKTKSPVKKMQRFTVLKKGEEGVGHRCRKVLFSFVREPLNYAFISI